MKINLIYGNICASNWTPASLCFFDGEGEGSGGAPGDGGNGGSPPGGEATPPGVNWTQFASSLDNLGENLGGKLDSLLGAVGEVRVPAQENNGPPPDLEAMSRPELVSHIVGTLAAEFKSQIEAALNPFAEQLGALQQNVTTRQVSNEIDTMRGQHKDFNEWKPEMVALAKEHPTLGITQLYRLARASFSEKATQLDSKYAPPPVKPVSKWGGLLPGMPGDPSGSDKPVDSKTAGMDAYREVQSRHPGVLAALENL